MKKGKRNLLYHPKILVFTVCVVTDKRFCTRAAETCAFSSLWSNKERRPLCILFSRFRLRAVHFLWCLLWWTKASFCTKRREWKKMGLSHLEMFADLLRNQYRRARISACILILHVYLYVYIRCTWTEHCIFPFFPDLKFKMVRIWSRKLKSSSVGALIWENETIDRRGMSRNSVRELRHQSSMDAIPFACKKPSLSFDSANMSSRTGLGRWAW